MIFLMWFHVINHFYKFLIAESTLTRKAPAFYSDGVYRMSGNTRPSPRSISQALMKGSDGLASRRNRTAMHTFFGKIFFFTPLISFFNWITYLKKFEHSHLDKYQLKIWPICWPLLDQTCTGQLLCIHMSENHFYS